MMGEKKKPFPKDKAVKGRKVKAQPSKARKKEKAKTHAKPNRISLACEGSGGGPGLAWDAAIQFVSDGTTYRMWTITEDGKLLLKHSSKPLSWRQMVADITRSRRVGLGGDLLEYVKIAGISGWQGLIVILAWCKFDSPAEEQFKFLLKLQDETIALLSKSLPASPPHDALLVIQEVLDCAWDLHIKHSVVEKGIRELAAIRYESPEAWCSAMEAWLRKRQPRGPSLVEIANISTAEKLANLVSSPSPSDSKVAAELLRRWATVDPKPILRRYFDNTSVDTAATFLEWLVERVGAEAFRELTREDSELAKKVVDAVVAYADSEIAKYQTTNDPSSVEARFRAGMKYVLSGVWAELKTRLLGEALAST